MLPPFWEMSGVQLRVIGVSVLGVVALGLWREQGLTLGRGDQLVDAGNDGIVLLREWA